jgi:hypothetical protein
MTEDEERRYVALMMMCRHLRQRYNLLSEAHERLAEMYVEMRSQYEIALGLSLDDGEEEGEAGGPV